MKLLLDTNAFLWLDNEPERLSEIARAACADKANTLALSMVSVWEMQIKAQLRKLSLRIPLAKLIEEQTATNGLEVLPMSLAHIYELGALPAIHRDPFDRILIAQSRVEGMPLVSADSVFADYGVKVIWREEPGSEGQITAISPQAGNLGQ